MIASGSIREHMEVVGSDGKHIGKVDHVLGDSIELTMRCRSTGHRRRSQGSLGRSASEALIVQIRAPSGNRAALFAARYRAAIKGTALRISLAPRAS